MKRHKTAMEMGILVRIRFSGFHSYKLASGSASQHLLQQLHTQSHCDKDI